MQGTESKHGQVVVITGAATGIGAECARAFAALGMTVVGFDVDDSSGTSTGTSTFATHKIGRLRSTWSFAISGGSTSCT